VETGEDQVEQTTQLAFGENEDDEIVGI